MREAIVREYDAKNGLLKSFATSLEILVREIIKESGIQCTVTSRVKERGSLIRKIEGKGDNYENLDDITDIAWLRIITYFEDDVPAVCAILEENLVIDNENSIDKGAALSVDQFWYRSVHKVASLSDERTALCEYRKYKWLKSEIQVRSVLQHAWAEMEHDIGYKSNIEVPAGMRRKFSRLAGLLELADQEFVRIRHELIDYDKEVKKQLKVNPGSIEIDKISLKEFLESDDISKRLDMAIAQIRGWKIIPSTTVYNDILLRKLRRFGISNLGALADVIKTEEKLIIEFAKGWLNRKSRSSGNFHAWIGIFYLCYVLIGKTKDPKAIYDYLKENIHFPVMSDVEFNKATQDVIDILTSSESKHES